MAETRLIDEYLVALRAALRLDPASADRVIDEARDHLLDARDAALARGATPESAEQEAISRFGSAEVVAARFVPAPCRMAYVLAALFALSSLQYFGFALLVRRGAAPGALLAGAIVLACALAMVFVPKIPRGDRAWFRVVRGLGHVPITWQGQAATWTFVLIALEIGLKADAHSHSVSDTLLNAWPPIGVALVLFFTLVYRTAGRPGRIADA